MKQLLIGFFVLLFPMLTYPSGKVLKASSSGEFFQVKMTLVESGDLCVGLEIKTVPGLDGYIEQVRIVQRGEIAALINFSIHSGTGRKYRYIGPADNRKRSPQTEFMYVNSDVPYVEHSCLGEMFEIDGDIAGVTFKSYLALLQKNEENTVVQHLPSSRKFVERHEIHLPLQLSVPNSQSALPILSEQ